MGRSVSTPSAARVVVYAHIPYEEDEDLSRINWDDDMANLKGALQAAFPLLGEADCWLGNEDHVILKNRLAAVTVSEYCGIVAVCLVPYMYEYGCRVDDAPLSVQCIKNAEGRFRKVVAEVFGETLVKMGTMSNGVGVFRKVGA